MKYIAKESFCVLKYRNNTFDPYYIYFERDVCYNEDKQASYYILINGCIFYDDNFNKSDMSDDKRFIVDYFYTIRESRKLKLDLIKKLKDKE